MSIRIINEDLDPNKQPNFYDGQKLNCDDLESLQIYLNNKIETSTKNIGYDGVVKGLRVELDTILAEPFPFPTVPQPSVNPDLQNYRDFPENILDVHDVRMYQTFLATTNNFQRLDLKLQILEGTGASVLFVELLELTVSSNPLSALSLNTLYMKQFASSELPSITSDGRLILDVSAENDNQGISLVPGNYYAIQLRFARETNSQDQLRIYHSNVAQTAAVDASLGAHFYVNGNFQQGLYNENAQLTQIILYNKIYTAAVQVTPGEAYFHGEHIEIVDSQRFLSLLDRRNVGNETEFANFIAVQFVLQPTDPESHPRTGNTVDSRYQDSFAVKVFNRSDWLVEVSKPYADQTWMLLAVATDRNVVPFSQRFDLQINQMTNLAYNDWLNSCIDTPSLSALQVKASRPDDFVFFIDNVPSQLPLLNDSGQQSYDQYGQPIIDRVSQVFLVLYLDGGANTRQFEMALYSSSTTTPPFNSYFVTITDPQGTIIPGLANFVFDIKELTPNTFYNYVAITERGRSIFIQDYNIQVRTPDPTTGILSLVRERQFDVVLNAGALTAVINEDLHLGDPIVPYGTVGQSVTGLESIQYLNEVPGRNGTTAEKTIVPVEDTLLLASNLQFEPLPMCFHVDPNPLIVDTITSVADAVAAEDIIIKVDGVPVTYSGTQGPERGGTGAPFVVSGQIKFSDDLVERLQQMTDLSISLGLPPPVDANDFVHFIGLRVTVRDIYGRDCSQQNIISVTNTDPSDPLDLTLIYRVIAMGRGAGFNSGFNTGQIGYVYIANRAVRDSVGTPIQFTYTPFGAAVSPLMDVRQIDTVLPGQILGLGTGEQWFGERDVVYATSSVGLANDEIGIHPTAGQVFLNVHDNNLIFNCLSQISPPATLSIAYYQLNEIYEFINYYFTRFQPWGDANSCIILNEDVSIQNAIANGWVVLEVNGSNLYTTGIGVIDLTNPINYVAMFPKLPLIVNSIIRVGSTAYVTLTGHGFLTGDTIEIGSADQSDYNGIFTVTVTGLNTFTYTVPGTPVTPATGVITATKIGPQNLLPADKISLNPETGRVVFGANIRPITSDVINITYYHLRPKLVCATNSLGATYDVRYDFNADGRVDQSDLNIFEAAYGSSTGDLNFNSQCDFNNNGTVDANDYQEFLDHFGTVASGSPSYREATLLRLNSILVFQHSSALRKFDVIRAYSESPSTEYPLGRTVLFFDTTQTPIVESGTYHIMFGFALALATGVSSFTITTSQPVTAGTNREIVEIFNVDDPTDVRQVVDITTTERISGNVIVYDNVITFVPSITSSGSYVVRALWHDNGLAVIHRADVVKTVFYEEHDRKNFGPFKMAYNSNDFQSDGTAMTIRFDASESTMADDTLDPSGLHLKGVPMEDMHFSILLLVPVDNNIVNVWKWHYLKPTAIDRGIQLVFNGFLAPESRYQGKNGVPVLQPFGVGQYQVDLRPKYAGGDVENDLSNIIVVRADQSPGWPLLHNHMGEAQGGNLTSQNVQFADPQSRFNTGNVTDVVYQLQDNLQGQINVLSGSLTDLQINASQVIVTNVPCIITPTTLHDALVQIVQKIAWDELDGCVQPPIP